MTTIVTKETKKGFTISDVLKQSHIGVSMTIVNLYFKQDSFDRERITQSMDELIEKFGLQTPTSVIATLAVASQLVTKLATEGMTNEKFLGLAYSYIYDHSAATGVLYVLKDTKNAMKSFAKLTRMEKVGVASVLVAGYMNCTGYLKQFTKDNYSKTTENPYDYEDDDVAEVVDGKIEKEKDQKPTSKPDPKPEVEKLPVDVQRRTLKVLNEQFHLQAAELKPAMEALRDGKEYTMKDAKNQPTVFSIKLDETIKQKLLYVVGATEDGSSFERYFTVFNVEVKCYKSEQALRTYYKAKDANNSDADLDQLISEVVGA